MCHFAYTPTANFDEPRLCIYFGMGAGNVGSRPNSKHCCSVVFAMFIVDVRKLDFYLYFYGSYL